jgi:hypothetical protein
LIAECSRRVKTPDDDINDRLCLRIANAKGAMVILIGQPQVVTPG